MSPAADDAAGVNPDCLSGWCDQAAIDAGERLWKMVTGACNGEPVAARQRCTTEGVTVTDPAYLSIARALRPACSESDSITVLVLWIRAARFVKLAAFCRAHRAKRR